MHNMLVLSLLMKCFDGDSMNDVNKLILELKSHEKLYHEVWLKTAKADNAAIFPLDLYSTAVTHRAICIISGFCDMIEGDNFICAAPLVRLLLDCQLRFYAVWLVDNPHEFASSILLDDAIVSKIKDRNGNKMTDSYLVQKMTDEYPWVKKVYRETSGYIHLSKKHYANTLSDFDDENRSMQVCIGVGDSAIPIDIKLEAIEAMIEISNILLKYLYGWASTKEKAAIAKKYNQKTNTE